MESVFCKNFLSEQKDLQDFWKTDQTSQADFTCLINMDKNTATDSE